MEKSSIAMYSLLGFGIIILGIILTMFIGSAHDVYVDIDKTQKLSDQIHANETCAELKDDIKFLNGLDEGHWIKDYSTQVDKDNVLLKQKGCS